MRRVLLCLPPAQTSNELDLFRAMPDTELIVVSDRRDLDVEDLIILSPRRLPLIGGRGGWTAAPAWLQGLTRLQPGPIDVVVSLELFSFGSWQAGGLARRLGRPHVVTTFETLAENPLYRLPPWRQITRRVVGSCTQVVCFTQRAAAHAMTLGCAAPKCVVVHPGVDTSCFFPARDPTASTHRPTVLFVGMLRADRGANKGVNEVVEACARVDLQVPGLRLQVVGDGPLRRDLTLRSSRLPFVEVLGRRTRPEIATLMREADVLVLASCRTKKWEEQFGFVLVEAMASGLPVVATRSGAIPEVVPAWNPLVQEGDVDGLAIGIVAALSAFGAGWGRRNRQHVMERFDLDRQAVKLAQALQRAIKAWTRSPTSWPRHQAIER